MQHIEKLPEELCCKPEPLIVLSGLDIEKNPVHKSIWKAFTSGHSRERETFKFRCRSVDHQFPRPKVKPSAAYEWFLPKGILKTGWMRKHLEEIPAVVAVFYDLDWDERQWDEKSTECAQRLGIVRSKLAGRDSKLVLVLIQKRAPLPLGEDLNAMERAQALCTKCELLGKNLFVLSHTNLLYGCITSSDQPKVELFKSFQVKNEANTVMTWLQIRLPSRVGEESKKSQRQSLKQSQVTLVLMILSTHFIPFQLLFVRHEFKIAFFGELKKDPALALKFEILGDLFQEAIQLSLSALMTQHPGLYYQEAARHAIARRELCSVLCTQAASFSVDGMVVPPTLASDSSAVVSGAAGFDETAFSVEFSGIHPSTGSGAETQRGKKSGANAAVELVRAQSPLRFARRSPSTPASPVTRSPPSSGQLDTIAGVLMGSEYYRKGNYAKALSCYASVIGDYRRDRWREIYTFVLQHIMKCAYFTVQLNAFISAALELIGSICPILSKHWRQETTDSLVKNGWFNTRNHFYTGSVSPSSVGPCLTSSKVCQRFSTLRRLFTPSTHTFYKTDNEKSCRSWARPTKTHQSLHFPQHSFIPVSSDQRRAKLLEREPEQSMWDDDRNPRSLHSFNSFSEVMCCLPFGNRRHYSRTPRQHSELHSPNSDFSSSSERPVKSVGSIRDSCLPKTLPRSSGSFGDLKNAFVGSRLDLDKLCHDLDERDSGIFSAQSLESLIFDLMERRAERNVDPHISKTNSHGTSNRRSQARRWANFSCRVLYEHHGRKRKEPDEVSRTPNPFLQFSPQPSRKRWREPPGAHVVPELDQMSEEMMESWIKCLSSSTNTSSKSSEPQSMDNEQVAQTEKKSRSTGFADLCSVILETNRLNVCANINVHWPYFTFLHSPTYPQPHTRRSYAPLPLGVYRVTVEFTHGFTNTDASETGSDRGYARATTKRTVQSWTQPFDLDPRNSFQMILLSMDSETLGQQIKVDSVHVQLTCPQTETRFSTTDRPLVTLVWYWAVADWPVVPHHTSRKSAETDVHRSSSSTRSTLWNNNFTVSKLDRDPGPVRWDLIPPEFRDQCVSVELPRIPPKWDLVGTQIHTEIQDHISKLDVSLLHVPPALTREAYTIRCDVFNTEPMDVTHMTSNSQLDDLKSGDRVTCPISIRFLLPGPRTLRVQFAYQTVLPNPAVPDFLISVPGCIPSTNLTVSIPTNSTSQLDDLKSGDRVTCPISIRFLLPGPRTLRVQFAYQTVLPNPAVPDFLISVPGCIPSTNLTGTQSGQSQITAIDVCRVPAASDHLIRSHCVKSVQVDLDVREPFGLTCQTLSLEQSPISDLIVGENFLLYLTLTNTSSCELEVVNTRVELEAQILLEPSPGFLFSGQSKTKVRLLPSSPLYLSYVFLPLRSGNVVLPRLRISLARFGHTGSTEQHTLKLHMEEKMLRPIPVHLFIAPSGKGVSSLVTETSKRKVASPD
ncbi:UPF0636 protein C4orf41 protein [Fasciola gigantica]|uniref:Trafficking protein particle complex subunit 11 n=1 Tax=Fasciola gigantica TaxID=46835 RepID=A0A504YQW1_FASGI|nr:UPF0636 protein C4orf41 protein [Fasciola gigantica]